MKSNQCVPRQEVALDRLIRGWGQSVTGQKPPYIFPGDKDALLKTKSQPYSTCSNLSSFTKTNSFGKCDGQLQLGLSPSPYVGDLRRATVFILVANPGLHVADFLVEEHRDLRQACHNTLRQKKLDGCFPFMHLNPKHARHPGFHYWFKKLLPVVSKVAEERRSSFLDALKYTAKRVACLDLLGYHSCRSGVQRLLGDLPSVKAMQEFVQCDLLRRAERGRATIIVTRCTTLWGLPPRPPQHVVVYTGHQCQGASLAPESPGGKAMLERLCCG